MRFVKVGILGLLGLFLGAVVRGTINGGNRRGTEVTPPNEAAITGGHETGATTSVPARAGRAIDWRKLGRLIAGLVLALAAVGMWLSLVRHLRETGFRTEGPSFPLTGAAGGDRPHRNDPPPRNSKEEFDKNEKRYGFELKATELFLGRVQSLDTLTLAMFSVLWGFVLKSDIPVRVRDSGGRLLFWSTSALLVGAYLAGQYLANYVTSRLLYETTFAAGWEYIRDLFAHQYWLFGMGCVGVLATLSLCYSACSAAEAAAPAERKGTPS